MDCGLLVFLWRFYKQRRDNNIAWPITVCLVLQFHNCIHKLAVFCSAVVYWNTYYPFYIEEQRLMSDGSHVTLMLNDQWQKHFYLFNIQNNGDNCFQSIQLVFPSKYRSTVSKWNLSRFNWYCPCSSRICQEWFVL